MKRKTISLLPRRRLRIKRLLFSRIGLTLVLVAAEAAILFAAYRFADSFRWFAVIQTLFSGIMFVYLLNTGMDASAKLTWSGLMMIAPFPAAIFLWYTQKDIGHSVEKERTAQFAQETRHRLKQDPAVLNHPHAVESGTDDLCKYLCRAGCYPLYGRTAVTYFPSGRAKFEALLEDLKSARKFIFMEYFIIAEGLMWGSILKILADKAAEGVDVRVMYDGMCEISTLSPDYPQLLARYGIRCKAFSPVTPFLSTQHNYRDHRKIVVIDGKTAYTGGVNLADEYIGETVRFGVWKDAAIRLQGDAAQSFTLIFLQMWNLLDLHPDWDETEICVPYKPDGFVLPYADCPLDGEHVGENIYLDLLYRAKTYVHIMTPYLILDGVTERALRFAAERGVDVKLILPGIPDKKAPYALAKTHYRNLLASGVEIYEFTPGFVHAKVFVSDDEKGVVGTINFDYRSLYHHFECAAYLYRTACIRDMEADFQQTLRLCTRVTEETIRNEPRHMKFLGAVMKLLAPLM